MNNVKSLILMTGIGLSLMACGQSKSDEHGKSSQQESTISQADVDKKDAQKILTAYLKVKDALVKTDGEAASTYAKELYTLLTTKNELFNKIKFDAEHIMNTKDVRYQRDHFNALSDHVYILIKTTSANDNTIYRQFCPMAFDNKGAYWLSAEKEVYNPYFGDQMLRCGTVKEELQ